MASSHQRHHPGPTWVYEYEDRNGVLLYVGITKSRQERMDAHRGGSPWFRAYAHTYRDRRYPTREIAETVERGLIIARTPVFNVEHQFDAKTAKACRLAYVERLHAVTTVSAATRPAYEFRMSCWLCPRWEAWAGNHHEADRWRDEHLLTG